MAAETTALATRTSGGDAAHAAEIEAHQSQRVMDTPRAREACRRLGFVMEDLQIRPFESFYIPGDMKAKQQLRFEHYDKKRRDRLAQVLAERAKVIAANARKGEQPGAQSGQFLCMLESLFEKEAKRLEGDLKTQLRHHSAMVKENEGQLRKEEMFQEKMSLVNQRRQAAETKKNMVGLSAKENFERRRERSDSVLAKLDTEYQEKQVSFAKHLLAEEERMERFEMEKSQLSAEKSAIWKAKVDRMKELSEQMTMEREIEGEAKLAELENRIVEVTARREEDQRIRQMRSEEQHLHLMDVREQKDRIDRQEGFRREELKEQLDGNVERIETLLALKDQLLDQRKARTTKAEAARGSRGVSLKRDFAPGPGAYEAPASCLTEAPSVKVAQSKVGHSEFIDQQVRLTAANPAPGAYDNTRVTKDGVALGKVKGAVNFSTRNRDSYLDDAVRAKSSVPAPGRYEARTQLDHRGTAMKRERIGDRGLDKFSAKQYPVWARPSTETPGPAGYSTDTYTRKEVLRRAQRSLPNLTRDMLRVGSAAKT